MFAKIQLYTQKCQNITLGDDVRLLRTNIPGCCWLLPLEQSLCLGEGVSWAEVGTGAGLGVRTCDENPGSVSVLPRGYLEDSCWQQCGCRWAHSAAGISSVQGRSCCVASKVYWLDLVLKVRPLLGLHSLVGSLSCMLALWSPCLTESNSGWTEVGSGLGKVWILSRSRSLPKSCL